ncbi:MAG: hypothetical protein ACKVOP_11260 [Sphingomonadaceae bacterium]
MADTTVAKAPRKKAATATANDIMVSDMVSDAASDASERTKTTVERVKEQAATLVSEAGDVARKAANTGKDKAVEALDGVAKLADDAAKAVDQHLGGNYGDYARKASANVHSAAQTLQTKEIDELIEDTKTFVRKNPAIAIGAAAAVGFLLTRLLKVGTGSSRD